MKTRIMFASLLWIASPCVLAVEAGTGSEASSQSNVVQADEGTWEQFLDSVAGMFDGEDE